MISQSLLRWYSINRRDLPWRRTRDPYAIWISEIMLQQTQVETVIPYYERFITRFPDIFRLADATEEEVLSLWKGLGYYTRARNLHQAAKVIREAYQGIFPESYLDIRGLPGIGDYTAGAIASIAFNQAYPAVDGNVLRVIARLLEIEEDISLPKTNKKITQITKAMIPHDQAGEFNQALMELGATCCVPKNPQCSICPLKLNCQAQSTGQQNILPVKKKAKPAVQRDYWAAIVCQNDSILMQDRNNTQLLGKMWGLPLALKKADTSAEAQFLDELGLTLKCIRSLGTVKHVFTHQIWQMEVMLFAMDESIELPEHLATEFAWISPERLKNLPIPKVFQKALMKTEDTDLK